MSQENVEIVRRMLEVWSRDDLGVDAGLDFLSPDCVIDWSRSFGPFAGIYHGHAGARELSEEGTLFESHRFEPHEFIDTGQEVIVPLTARLRGRDGIEVTVKSVLVFRVEDGLVTSFTMYQDRKAALEAVGLSE